MKDYSEFIKSEYGFITNIDIDKENNSIKVMTSKSKKGQPHEYELTQEKLEELYQKLKSQYLLLIKNSDEIYINKNQKNRIIVSIIQTICFIAAFIVAIASALSGTLALLPLIAGLVLTIVGTEKILKEKQKKFNEMIATYDYFIKNKYVIEKVSKKDHNIQLKLNNKTANIISQNADLKNEGLIDNVYDIQLMDKMSLKQLKNMLLRYKISTELSDEPRFESKEEKTKKLKK